MDKLVERLLQKSTVDGVSILGIVLSFWLAPEISQEIASCIATIWGVLKIGQQD